MKFRVFISSVQSEFAEERRRLVEYIRQDALLGRFFDPFIFEETPACDLSARGVYLSEVEACDIYLGLIGECFGNEVEPGLSATECEYDCATRCGKTRLIFVKEVNRREEQESWFLNKIQSEVTRKRFDDYGGLQLAVYGALVRHLESAGYLRMTPFDASFDSGLTVADVDETKVEDFLSRARRTKKLTVPPDADAKWVLEKLNAVSSDGHISNAAVLLFTKNPQRKFISSEVKCLQYWGDVVERPIPSYRFFQGTLIEMIEDAVAFVMSRIDHEVLAPKPGTAMAEGRNELPELAVREAIVNAVCHRNYEDNGSVQVMLFRNRLEIINPGSLPKGWTVKKLLETHDSRSPNLTIAQALNWAGFVEKSGNGTESIISLCTEQGLKSPEYFADNVDFKAIVWRKQSVSDGLKSGLKIGQSQRPEIGQSYRPEIGQSQSLRQTVDTKILSALARGESSRKQLSVVLGVSIQAGWFKKTLQRMLEDGLVEYSIPDKPQSRLQKYRLTEKAVVLMRRQKGT